MKKENVDELKYALSCLSTRVEGLGGCIEDGFRDLRVAVSGILDAESLKSSYVDLLSEYEDLKSEHESLELKFADLVDENDGLRDRLSELKRELSGKTLFSCLKEMFHLG